MISKTFRLFISSTFSDFSKEREVLQTSVFPKIRGYASSKGYTFQPIDLRWGVSNEAQLDQKTLELCLEEVRSCKIYPHPNFLIMIGDRYGWVPLPYAIEENEFEQIRAFIEKKAYHDHLKLKYGKALSCLNRWYTLDKNNQPASYILKERTGYSKNYEVWGKHEIFLRTILQESVGYIKISEVDKRKYFLSATEAEVEEGIIPYLNTTDYQKELIKKDKALKTIDPEHIFGFLRDIEKDTKKDDMFIVDNEDYLKAQTFKQNVKKELDNILELKTSQKEKKLLDESYLERFKEKAISFLVNQIDEQIKKEDEQKKLIVEQFDDEEKDRLFKLQVECEAQKYFVEQKRKNFMETESLRILLDDINDYVSSSQTSNPLVIHGSSGVGKSAIMAKAVEETLNDISEKKVIFRFVGATANASSSKEILLSIFDELGKNASDELEKIQENKDRLSENLNDAKETFDQFSDRINHEFMSIKEEVVIFIDAVDQLTNEDEFVWLPAKLPSNVKIIISALDDEKYENESKYFRTLKYDREISNIYPILEFNEPEKLLSMLLKKDNRCVQLEQMVYFKKQYKAVNTPLYITMAVQEMKHWKSDDSIKNNPDNKLEKKQSLSTTQKGIIKEFIENLSKVYHHDERFVHKVLGYLYASKDGLSESELLQLISTDETFIKQMSPETWHNNPTKELPVVHWSRLYTQLKPFLSLKTQDDEELMYFFHREFEDVVKNLSYQKEGDESIIYVVQREHEAMIIVTQKMILNNQNKDFNKNRWGKLYSLLALSINSKSKNISSDFFIGLNNYNWVSEYMVYVYLKIINNESEKNITLALLYGEHAFSIVKALYSLNSKIWIDLYVRMGTILFYCYQVGEPKQALTFLEEIVNKLEYTNQRYYFEIQLALASGYGRYFSKRKNGIEILKKLYNQIDDQESTYRDFFKSSIMFQLGNLYGDTNDKLSVFYHEKNFKFWERLSADLLGDDEILYLARAQNSLARSLSRLEKCNKDRVINLYKKSHEIRKKFYKQNKIKYVDIYLESLNDLSVAYNSFDNNHIKALEMQEVRFGIIYDKYMINKDVWREIYFATRISLANLYAQNDNIDKAYDYLETNHHEYENIFKKDSEYWAEHILHNITALITLEDKYKRYTEIDFFILNRKKIDILKKLCEIDCTLWMKKYFNFVTLFIDNFTTDNNSKEMIILYEQSLTVFELVNCKKEKLLRYNFESNFSYDLVEEAVKYYNKSELSNSEWYFEKLFFYADKFFKNGNDSHIDSYILGLLKYANYYRETKKEKSNICAIKVYELNQYMYKKYQKKWGSVIKVL